MNDPEFQRNVLAELSGIRKALEEISKALRKDSWTPVKTTKDARDTSPRVVQVPAHTGLGPAYPLGDPPKGAPDDTVARFEASQRRIGIATEGRQHKYDGIRGPDDR